MSEKANTTKVRIAVAVDEEGRWTASGASWVSPERSMTEASEWGFPGETRYWVEAELPIPGVPVVQGKVEVVK